MDPGDDGPRIEASDEMEAALREATESMEAREAARAEAQGGEVNPGPETADKKTIELLSDELQALKAQHEQTLADLESEKDQHVRLQAEFENFRRRSLKEKQDGLKFGHQNLVKDLLSTVDNLERALEHGAQNDGPDGQGILDGVELVHREILGALAKHAVTEIDAQGKPFDPAVHEAMGQVPSEEVAVNTVLQVLQKGYVIHDRMLRPARVLVSRAPAEQAASADGANEADE
jgi:molecular chaperone GrpE